MFCGERAVDLAFRHPLGVEHKRKQIGSRFGRFEVMLDASRAGLITTL